MVAFCLTQGSAFLATLGFQIYPRWGFREWPNLRHGHLAHATIFAKRGGRERRRRALPSEELSGYDVAIRVESVDFPTVRADTAWAREIRAQAEAGEVFEEVDPAAVDVYGVLVLSVGHGTPHVARPLLGKIVILMQIDRALEGLGLNVVGAKNIKHPGHTLVRRVHGIARIGLDDRKIIFVIAEVELDGAANRPQVSRAGDAAGLIDCALQARGGKSGKNGNDHDDCKKFDEGKAGPVSELYFHGLDWGAAFAACAACLRST